MHRTASWLLAGIGTVALALAACTGDEAPAPEPGTVDVTPERPAIEGPAPALLVSQAWFETEGGRPVPQPAKLTILRTDGEHWDPTVLLDEASNVYHKAVPWRDGILAIGGTKARLVHWTKSGDEWASETLWEQSWGGDFDRLRDMELGDVDGDGADEIVLATHDQGVVAVGDEGDAGWTFHEFGQKADTFVHEIEIGDVDGDGSPEFYATPSDKNRASLESQPGSVARYHLEDGEWKQEILASWDESHAKEILVADLGTGSDQLFAVREGHTKKVDGKTELLDPVTVVRLDPGPDGWTQTPVATLDDHQMRFLVPGDVDGDDQVELVAAGFKSGLWLLEPQGDGTFEAVQIDKNSSGFEHATHVADLDDDGVLEIYVAADDQGKLRRYTWNGESFDRTDLFDIPKGHLTWNIQDANL